MKKALPLTYLVAVAAFCSLPYLVGLAAPTLAVPWAEYTALLFLVASAVAYALSRHSTLNLGFLPVYLLGCVAMFFSSASWFGMPFIDAVFMLTALGSAVAAVLLAVAIVVRLFRSGRPRSKSNARGGV